MRWWRGGRKRLQGQRGFTLIELLVVVAVIGILATIAISLYSRTHTQARVARVQADLRAIGSAISIYQTHMGALPATLSDLTAATTNGLGQPAGPFLASIPSPPAGGSPAWSAYSSGYVTRSDGSFTLTSTGDGYTITVP